MCFNKRGFKLSMRTQITAIKAKYLSICFLDSLLLSLLKYRINNVNKLFFICLSQQKIILLQTIF